jgi:hypothetical protein
MGEAEIEVEGGVSWLHDKQLSDLREREHFLLEACGSGLQFHEYLPMCGRLRECRRQMQELAELFAEFHQAEESEDGELEEIE